LRRYVQEASKQCGRNRLMQIEPPLEWSTLIARSEGYPRRWLGQPGGSRLAVPSSPADALVAVGPEGGLTSEEVASALQEGWSAIDLGPRILRVETAALVLAAFASLSPA
jgi:16S rRNA (uracil1498-N3)-methyltransferase